MVYVGFIGKVAAIWMVLLLCDTATKESARRVRAVTAPPKTVTTPPTKPTPNGTTNATMAAPPNLTIPVPEHAVICYNLNNTVLPNLSCDCPKVPDLKQILESCPVQPDIKKILESCPVLPDIKEILKSCPVQPDIKKILESCPVQPDIKKILESCPVLPDIKEILESFTKGNEKVLERCNTRLESEGNYKAVIAGLSTALGLICLAIIALIIFGLIRSRGQPADMNGIVMGAIPPQ